MRWNFEEVLKEFPQLAERIDNPGGALSGGEQQMLAIGRALMANPELILMDEPSEGLSPRLVQQVQEIMQRLRSLGQAILLVEQNLQLALSAADDVYVLSAGQFVFQGTAAALANETQVLDQHLGVCEHEDGLIHTRRSYGNGNHHNLGPSPATVHWGFLDAKIPAAPDHRVGRHGHHRHRFRRPRPMSAIRRSCCRTIARSASS